MYLCHLKVDAVLPRLSTHASFLLLYSAFELEPERPSEFQTSGHIQKSIQWSNVLSWKYIQLTYVQDCAVNICIGLCSNTNFRSLQSHANLPNSLITTRASAEFPKYFENKKLLTMFTFISVDCKFICYINYGSC